MKRVIILSVIMLCAACTPDDIARVDRAVREAPAYEAALQDSLRGLKETYLHASTDSVRWESAVTLYHTYSHYQLDSALAYAQMLQKLAGEDRIRQVEAGAARAEAASNMGNFFEAVEIFEQIDTALIPMAGSVGNDYYTAGLWVYKGLGRLSPATSDHYRKLADVERNILLRGDTFIEAVNIRYNRLCDAGRYEEAIALVEGFMGKNMTVNEYARSHYFLSRIYHLKGDRDREIHHLTLSACADLEAAVKNYNSLYNLALILYEKGDLERASRYIKKNLDDALFSSSSGRLLRSARSEMLFSEALHRSETMRRRVITLIIVLLSFLTAALVAMAFRLRKYARTLEAANKDIGDLSRIKDTFLAQYMEMAASYIGKVDQTKSTMRRTLKQDGVDALKALLRTPSYADSEYENFYRRFDRAFLGIYPDFVKDINSLMKPECTFVPQDGELSTQLRILALIRLGITERTRIAQILHVSVTTVYTYLSRTQRDALPYGIPLEEAVKGL